MAPHSEKRLQVHINKRAVCQSKQSRTVLPVTRNSAPDSCHSPAQKPKSGFVLANAGTEHGEHVLPHSKTHLCTAGRKVNSGWMSFFPFFLLKNERLKKDASVCHTWWFHYSFLYENFWQRRMKIPSSNAAPCFVLGDFCRHMKMLEVTQ